MFSSVLIPLCPGLCLECNLLSRNPMVCLQCWSNDYILSLNRTVCTPFSLIPQSSANATASIASAGSFTQLTPGEVLEKIYLSFSLTTTVLIFWISFICKQLYGSDFRLLTFASALLSLSYGILLYVALPYLIYIDHRLSFLFPIPIYLYLISNLVFTLHYIRRCRQLIKSSKDTSTPSLSMVVLVALSSIFGCGILPIQESLRNWSPWESRAGFEALSKKVRKLNQRLRLASTLMVFVNSSVVIALLFVYGRNDSNLKYFCMMHALVVIAVNTLLISNRTVIAAKAKTYKTTEGNEPRK